MDDYPDPKNDIVLIALVHGVNIGGFTFKITMQVGGMVVSGIVVPVTEFQSMLRSAEHRGANQAGENLTIEPETPSEKISKFIHLKDVRFLVPGMTSPIGSSAFPIWRYRISDVNGWMFGQATF